MPPGTTGQILRLFAPLERHRLYRDERLIEVVDPQLMELLQAEALRLLGSLRLPTGS